MTSPIPTTPHWAIITETSRTIYTPGDERSRTCPGHGYPSSSETIKSIHYEAFLNERTMLKQAEELHLQNKNFRVLWVEPAKIETRVAVKVSR